MFSVTPSGDDLPSLAFLFHHQRHGSLNFCIRRPTGSGFPDEIHYRTLSGSTDVQDITLKQLEIFNAVVVAGSITKASRRIDLSQPSISQQLAKFEARLGC